MFGVSAVSGPACVVGCIKQKLGGVFRFSGFFGWDFFWVLLVV